MRFVADAGERRCRPPPLLLPLAEEVEGSGGGDLLRLALLPPPLQHEKVSPSRARTERLRAV